MIDGLDGDARATTVRTARGTYATPCFMPVGTRGAVKTLSAADLAALGVDVMLANTYHLMLRPGTAVVRPPLPAPVQVIRDAVDRTAAWAERAKREFDQHRVEGAAGAQSLFGIVQGGVDEALRVESARRTVEVGFDGYAVGGLSVGES